MELKAIIAIALVVFIIGDHCHCAGGIHHRRPDFPESQKPEEVTSQGRPCGAAPFTYQKRKELCR